MKAMHTLTHEVFFLCCKNLPEFLSSVHFSFQNISVKYTKSLSFRIIHVNGNRSNTNKWQLVEYISDMETGWHQQNVAAKASTGRPQVIINFSIISHSPTPHPSAFDFFNI
jgi:hypothetical protein